MERSMNRVPRDGGSVRRKYNLDCIGSVKKGSARLKTTIRTTRQIAEGVPSRVSTGVQAELETKNYKADYMGRLRVLTKDDGTTPRHTDRVLNEYSGHLAKVRQSFGYDILRPNRLSNLLWRFFDEDGTRVCEDVADRARVLRELLTAYKFNRNKTGEIMRSLERIYARKNPASSSSISYITNKDIRDYFGLHSVFLSSLENVGQISISSQPNTSTVMAMGNMEHSQPTGNIFPRLVIEPSEPAQAIQTDLINVPEDFDLDRYSSEETEAFPAGRQEELDDLDMASQMLLEGIQADAGGLTEFDMESPPETTAFTLLNMSEHELAGQGRQEDQEMVQAVLASDSDAIRRMIRWYQDRLQYCELLEKAWRDRTGI